MATTISDRVHTGHVAETTPYAWPWNGVLDAARTVVLVLEAPGEDHLIEQHRASNAGIVVATLRQAGALAIRVITRRTSPTRPFGTSARAFVAEGTGEIPTDETIGSQGVDGFFGSPLETLLRRAGIERVILVVADTAHNRAMLDVHREDLRSSFPLDGRQLLPILRSGRAPEASGILVL